MVISRLDVSKDGTDARSESKIACEKKGSCKTHSSHFDFVRVSRTISWGYGKVGDEIVDIYFALGDSPLRFHKTAENIRTHRVVFVLCSCMEENVRN